MSSTAWKARPGAAVAVPAAQPRWHPRRSRPSRRWPAPRAPVLQRCILSGCGWVELATDLPAGRPGRQPCRPAEEPAECKLADPVPPGSDRPAATNSDNQRLQPHPASSACALAEAHVQRGLAASRRRCPCRAGRRAPAGRRGSARRAGGTPGSPWRAVRPAPPRRSPALSKGQQPCRRRSTA